LCLRPWRRSGNEWRRGRNGDLQLVRLDEFIAALDAFILDRSVRAELEGTYGSYIRFEGDAGGVSVAFSVGDQDAHGRHAVTGVFPIAQDELLSLLAGFRALARP
jgi:hypothetical protein